MDEAVKVIKEIQNCLNEHLIRDKDLLVLMKKIEVDDFLERLSNIGVSDGI